MLSRKGIYEEIIVTLENGPQVGLLHVSKNPTIMYETGLRS